MSTELDPIAELAASINRHRELTDRSRADLVAATPTLIAAIRHQSGQSAKIEKILWSCWNDEHPTSLCDAISGLDIDIAIAVLAMIAARAHGGGDADELLREIIEKSGSKPPRHRADTAEVS